MKTLFLRHYQAIIRRGLINEKTTTNDFLKKIHEELNEVMEHYDNFTYNTSEFDQELIDLAMTCFNCLTYFNRDIETELQKNVKKQEMRAKIRTKILGIEFIIETIDNELNNYPELNRQIYLQERKEINLKKLYKLEAENK